MKTIIRAGLQIICAFLVVVTTVGCGDNSSMASGGNVVHELKAESWINTEPLTMEALKGKIVILNFWATWCPPCRQSTPHLRKLHDEYKDQGVVLISISNEDRKTIEPFAADNGMTWPLAIGSKSGQDYGVQGIPHAILVDREGKIVWRGHPMSGMDEEIKKLLSAAE